MTTTYLITDERTGESVRIEGEALLGIMESAEKLLRMQHYYAIHGYYLGVLHVGWNQLRYAYKPTKRDCREHETLVHQIAEAEMGPGSFAAVADRAAAQTRAMRTIRDMPGSTLKEVLGARMILDRHDWSLTTGDPHAGNYSEFFRMIGGKKAPSPVLPRCADRNCRHRARFDGELLDDASSDRHYYY